MNVVVTLEHRFDCTPDGKVWTQTTFPYSFWKRYLEVFEHIRVVARVRSVKSVPSDWKQVNGEGVSFAAVPYYVGPWQYFLRSRSVKQAVRNAVEKNDAVILRVSSQLATCLKPYLRKQGHPYAVEVVADPYDVFAPGSIRHPLRPYFRWSSWYKLKLNCADACAAAYVTKEALQRRYPCNGHSVGISDVVLPEWSIVSTPRQQVKTDRALNLIFVGTMAQLYKAPNVLIDAVALCVKQGVNIKLTLVGDGQYRTELEAQAAAQGIEERVCFYGQLPGGEAVRAHLDRSDLFILPSYQEGLPRAMVEAMARALPCIGSTVGGIPELLLPEDMVPPGDRATLASKIREVVSDPERMVRMSARNLQTAKHYTDEILDKQRIAFYQYIRDHTQAWLKQKK